MLRAATTKMAHALVKSLKELEAQVDKLQAKASGQESLGPKTLLVESVTKHFKGTAGPDRYKGFNN